MAWIEDSTKGILLVRQATGLKLWTLPGGKVKRAESLVKALKREVHEETGLRVQIGSLLGVLDRHDKDAITLLFAAFPNKRSIKVRKQQEEIKKVTFQASLPNRASPSAKYFWSARKGPIKKAPRIRASTHQFPGSEDITAMLKARITFKDSGFEPHAGCRTVLRSWTTLPGNPRFKYSPTGGPSNC
jgi:ADP-ribose pyrophosphatase YjhB (NUDIX family)